MEEFQKKQQEIIVEEAKTPDAPLEQVRTELTM